MNVCEPDPHQLYPLRAVARMTGSSERKIVFYCRKGIVIPQSPPHSEEYYFDELAVLRLRKIEILRQEHRMNWAAIKMIMSLLHEVEVLRDELRFHR